jgi:feruloyl esterase
MPACDPRDLVAPPDVDLISIEPVESSEEGPAHCRVAGVIGADIEFELLLPRDWNGKLVMGGGGGFVGKVENQAQEFLLLLGRSPLARSYATVGTDTGHDGTTLDASWAFENLERKLNFGHRAVHLTAETAKSLTQSFYRRPPRRSYFMGCSRGGGQAMMESQLYPNDFDGIVAGAPAFNWGGIMAGFIKTQQAMYPTPNDLTEPVLTAETRKLLETRILAKCDAIDGVRDGVLDDPRRCDFRVSELPNCELAGRDCITDAERHAIEAIYQGPRRGGTQIFFGFPFGGENDRGAWVPWIVGGAEPVAPGAPSLQYAFGTQAMKYLFLDDPDFDYTRYDFSTFGDDTRFGASILKATDTDLTDFESYGGKLLMWHGWSDSALTALATIDYYDDVAAKDADVGDYFRLFMMPGVLHCSGGPGPDELLASRIDGNGNVIRSRPLCPILGSRSTTGPATRTRRRASLARKPVRASNETNAAAPGPYGRWPWPSEQEHKASVIPKTPGVAAPRYRARG